MPFDLSRLARDLVSRINDDAALANMSPIGLPAKFAYLPIIDKEQTTAAGQVFVVPGRLTINDEQEDTCESDFARSVFVQFVQRLGPKTGVVEGENNEVDAKIQWVERFGLWLLNYELAGFGKPFDIDLATDSIYDWEWLLTHRVFSTIFEVKYRELG